MTLLPETTAAGEPVPSNPLNVVFLVSDDQGWGELATYRRPSDDPIYTPHLDGLAADGMRFTQFYSAPVCSPGRATILTGRNSQRNGVWTWSRMERLDSGERVPVELASTEISLATLLRHYGYDTAVAGKWHLSAGGINSSEAGPAVHGFNHHFVTSANASPSHHNPTNFYRNGSAVGEIQGYSALIVADEAEDWLRSLRDPAKPFFLYVTFHEPHVTRASAPEFMAMYPDGLSSSDRRPVLHGLQPPRRAGARLPSHGWRGSLPALHRPRERVDSPHPHVLAA